MKTTLSRKQKKTRKAFHVATCGRERVPVYKRTAPNGSFCFMVANYADGKRRFDSYANEPEAVEAAGKLARQMSEREVLAAAMTNGQAQDYANAVQRLSPYGVALSDAVSTVAECLKLVGDLPNLHAAVKFYRARHKQTTARRVADVVAEMLAIKGSRGASVRYAKDLRLRLTRFTDDCKKDMCNVTTADIQAWLDGLNLSPQSYRNYKTVLHLLFQFAVARGYAADNPVQGAEKIKVRNGDVEVFTPIEIARLLEAARVNFHDYLPCIAIGAFAGLRSAEIERLSWADVNLAGRHIVVSAGNAKTASRRIVPLHDNLAAWLAPYANRQGKLWGGTSMRFYERQADIAAATAVEADADKGIAAKAAVKWKANGLRHSYASYRFAQTGDAGRVAGELGNSAAVVHRHYRVLVKPADTEKWFSIKPESPANVLALSAVV